MLGIPLGRSFFSAPDWTDPYPHQTPEGPKPRIITLANVASVPDLPLLRRCAEHDGWPAHCPDPRCGAGAPGGPGGPGGKRCVGAVRRLAPGRPRDYPSCYAFALAALIHRADLPPDLQDPACEMLPAMLLGENEMEVGGPALGFTGPSPGFEGGRLAERLVFYALLHADGADAEEWYRRADERDAKAEAEEAAAAGNTLPRHAESLT